MKAISIRQPWAWLVAQALKPIENRTWTTSYRGRILIHAGKIMTRREYADVHDFLIFNRSAGASPIDLPPFEALARGGIVGVATLDEIIHPSARKSTWHIEGCFGFHMTNAKPLPIVPCNGALGIFEVEPHVAKALNDLYAPLLAA